MNGTIRIRPGAMALVDWRRIYRGASWFVDEAARSVHQYGHFRHRVRYRSHRVLEAAVRFCCPAPYPDSMSLVWTGL